MKEKCCVCHKKAVAQWHSEDMEAIIGRKPEDSAKVYNFCSKRCILAYIRKEHKQYALKIRREYEQPGKLVAAGDVETIQLLLDSLTPAEKRAVIFEGMCARLARCGWMGHLFFGSFKREG